ncbi:MAG: DUF3108 domain-containing protein [Steroidobacteraceae bacterium]
MSSRSAVFLLAGVCSLAALDTAAAVETVAPFTATYGVEWRGMGAGTSTLELVQSDGDLWTYRSRNTARGIFRLAFPQAITQMSVFRIRDDKVVPLTYRSDDGSKNTGRDVSLDFDWSEHRVTGVAEDERVDVALQPGTQDAMSVQIALIRELEAGRSPERFVLIDKDELKEYLYTSEGTERVSTGLGEFDTVVYRSQRNGSKRVTRLWLAPSLGYVPVRAQQVRGGRVEFTMSLRKLERKG